jgi:LmbE family N-acetylglucosaminyl deacetylase
MCQNGRRRSIIEDPEFDSNSRVLVLAPHFDDAIIGCGGTVDKLARHGAHVKVLFITETCYQSPLGPPSRLMPMDPKQVEESLGDIRCYEHEHLEMPCMGLSCGIDSRNELLRVLDQYAPTILMLPSPQERHPDNRMTAHMAARALKGYDGNVTIYSYHVWGDLFPNTMVEITETMGDKLSAAMVRRSHVPPLKLEQRLRETNAFRKSSMQPDRYGEPFLRLERAEFVRMHGRIGFHGRAVS